jgi:hypothetical protein
MMYPIEPKKVDKNPYKKTVVKTNSEFIHPKIPFPESKLRVASSKMIAETTNMTVTKTVKIIRCLRTLACIKARLRA